MATITGDGGAALRKLAVRLEEVPRKTQTQVRRAVRDAAEGVRSQAAQDASWSRTIPGALVVRTSFAGVAAGAYVVARASVAPSARPFEGITGRSVIRHPTFGHEPWEEQPVRPFLTPALEAEQDKAIGDINDAVTAALAEAGL